MFLGLKLLKLGLCFSKLFYHYFFLFLSVWLQFLPSVQQAELFSPLLFPLMLFALARCRSSAFIAHLNSSVHLMLNTHFPAIFAVVTCISVVIQTLVFQSSKPKTERCRKTGNRTKIQDFIFLRRLKNKFFFATDTR